MPRNELDMHDEIEEIRELLYDIAKKSSTGVDSVTLAEEYDRQFVQTGIARPLPAAWLRYVKVADEFAVRQEDGKTIIGVIQHNSIPILKDLNIPKKPTPPSAAVVADEPPAPTVDLKSLPLSSMPTSRTKVHVLTVTDPDNISVRLCSWDPMPDYLYSVLSKDFENDAGAKTGSPIIHQPVEGAIYVAKLPNGSWERVQLVRASSLMASKGYYVVYAVDVGIYHLVHRKNLRPVNSNLCAFDKVLLAKCRLAGIRPKSNASVWPKDAQQAISDWLSDAQGTEIEMIPKGEWRLSDGPSSVPFISAQLIVNGENIGEKMVQLGLAEPADE